MKYFKDFDDMYKEAIIDIKMTQKYMSNLRHCTILYRNL